MFYKFRAWLISKIAMGDLFVVNAHISSKMVKEPACAVYIPFDKARLTSEEAETKGVIAPAKNVKS